LSSLLRWFLEMFDSFSFDDKGEKRSKMSCKIVDWHWQAYLAFFWWAWFWSNSRSCSSGGVGAFVWCLWTGQGHCQVGSLAGAAHLLNSNAGVQRWAQQEQKSCVEQKGKSSFDFWFSVQIETEKSWPIDPLTYDFENFQARGVRKVTTGITGLWQPSAHSDVAFWSFDVGSSYPALAEGRNGWIVHPLTGNVSWV